MGHNKSMLSNLRNIRRILIRSANWIGDAVMTIPAVRAVRKNFPGAEISILAKPWVAPVFENSSHTDHLLIYEAAGRHKGFAGKFRLARDLKSHHFDAAILFQNAFEAAFIAFLAGIPNRIGYDTDGRSLLLSHNIRCTPELREVHQVEYYLGILEGAGLRTDGQKLHLEVSPEDRHRAGEILRRYGISQKESPVVGINPGATFGTAKRWFPERYAALCRRLQKSVPADILVFGGPGEEALGHRICEDIGNRCVNLCGKTTLREAIALIKKCRLFITNDSGLMHVAAALDVPQIAIFGSTDHITTAPASPESHIVRVPTPCSPCLKPDCPEGHHSCMKEITVDMVYSVISEQLVSYS
ncbi:lipopolysaccharide heptosyltransferase II [Desulfobacterales bacterium HSG2]|nr:lipopolysaccharide heptosyltransferase II [Desulfobacterales bacterium HSG2]